MLRKLAGSGEGPGPDDKPEDSQRMACSRTEASSTSVRMMTAARAEQGFLGTRDGPILGGGSVGRSREHLLKHQQVVGLGTEN